MQPKPLLSIITVTFNASGVIGLTLDSLKSQRFSDFEHIVIDGASADNTVEIIKESGLPGSKVISEPDKGLYDAMNKGLSMAEGKYVLFLNAGDRFHDDGTLSLYAEEAQKDRDIIYGNTIIVDSEGKKLADRHLSVPEALSKSSFADGMLVCHQAFMVKRELAPLFDLSYRFSSDYDWCVKCLDNSKPENCANLKTVVIDYLNDGLTDQNKLKSLRERFTIMRNHYGLIPTLTKHFKFVIRALRRGCI